MLKALKILIVVSAAFSLAGCGGEAPKARTQAEAMGAPTVSTNPQSKKARKKDEVVVAKGNSSWDRIAEHFFKFSKGMDSDLHSGSLDWRYRDIFRNNYETFFPAPMEALVGKGSMEKPREAPRSAVMGFIDALKKAGEKPMELGELFVEEEAAPEPELDPLLKRPLQDYQFRVIMSGVANPQTMVVDTEGNTYLLKVNDRIGSEGGYIMDILKHDVLVKLPEQESPQVVSLAPPEIPAQMRIRN